MINKKDIKNKLDELLIQGHIDSEEYKHIVTSLTEKTTKKSSNKKIIIFSVILLLIYVIFSTYQDIKVHEKIEFERMMEYNIGHTNLN